MRKYCKAIEELLVAKGEKVGYYFVGDVTTGEILEKMDLPVVRVNHHRALQIIRSFYPKSSFEKSSEGDGYNVRVRIRSK